MASNLDMAALGRLLASPARVTMLDALFDGRSWAVGELAAAARVAPSTASEHLRLLRVGGLVVAVAAGRFRRYRLAGGDVATALELLGTLAPPLASRGLADAARADALRAARTCYDHLAGRLGVAIADALVAGGLVRDAGHGFQPTREGERVFVGVGIDTAALRRARRPYARACLDWSERRSHLAGGLGASLLARIEAVRGLERLPTPRAVRLLPPGRALLEELGVPVGAAA